MSRIVRANQLRKLLPAGSRVLVATSGGPDSQALLHILASQRDTLCVHIFAIGVNHQLRSGAPAELAFARRLAQRLSVNFEQVDVEVRTRGNLMQNARFARHHALKDCAERLDAHRIALGHTATDVAETVMMNLARGCSLRGAGPMPMKKGRVVRPLLNATRADTRSYCNEQGIEFAEDPTNQDLKFRRPLMRHTVLPALRTVSPDADRAIARFAREVRRVDEGLQNQARAFLEEHRTKHGPAAQAPCSLPVDLVRSVDAHLRSTIVRGLLESKGIRVSRRRLNRITGALSCPQFLTRFDHAAIGIDRGHLFALNRIDYRQELEDGWVLPPWGATFAVSTRRRVLPPPNPTFPKSGVAFDAEAIHLPLLVRPWARGDQIRCFGHGGRAKVGDLFTDAKIPRPLRDAWPVVVHGDEIIWVPGIKRSNFGPVTELTRVMQVVELSAALYGSTP